MNSIEHIINKLFAKLSILLLSLYAYSRLSWGFIIPSIGWAIILVAAISFMLMSRMLTYTKYTIKSFDICSLLLFLMVVIIAVWNNNDIIYDGYTGLVSYVTIMLFYIMAVRTNIWFQTAIRMMIFMGIFYAVWTIICYLEPSIYYNSIYPMMSRYNTTYTAHVSAGFTAHYSTNGLYMMMGLCGCLGYYFFCGNVNKKYSKARWFILVIIILGTLLSGKRGQIISFFFAFFVTYYIYKAGNPTGRIFKICLIFFSACIIIYIVSFFIPDVLYVVERFVEESEKSDFSNGRLAFWVEAWKHFITHPLFGNGWRWFRYHNDLEMGVDVHNCFLQLLVEVGVIGSIPFYMFIGISYIRACRLAISVREGKTVLERGAERFLFTALLYQSFFLPFTFEGTTLYMPECIYPYLISCAIVHY